MSPGEHPDGAGLQARDMSALVDPARKPRDNDVARLSQAARQPLGEGRVPPPRRCASRRSPRPPCARPPPGRAERGSAARNRSPAARADSPASPSATKRTPSFDAAISSFSTSSTEAMRIGRLAPPRLASSGSAFSAPATLPQLVTSARKVRGPTFSERTSRSQSKRC